MPASRIAAALEPFVADGTVPGLVAYVANGATAETIALGKMAFELDAPMRADTLFRIASMTKVVTAAAAMVLIEEGKLKRDEPVENLLPELANRMVLRNIDSPLDDVVPAKRAITIDDVMTFQLGLGLILAPPDTYPIQKRIRELGLMGFGPPDPASPLDFDEWMRRLGTLPLMAQPGEQWLYTAGSNVLGVLIARASGRSLPDFFRERIFAPLGMADTDFFAPPAKAARLSSSYQNMNGKLLLLDGPARSFYLQSPVFPAGDAGLVSTARDFAIFARMLLADGVHEGRRILSEMSVHEMIRDHLTRAQRAGGRAVLGQNRGWGYGLAVVDARDDFGVPAGSYGWNGGRGTSWISDPSAKRVALLLTQRSFDSPDPPAVHKAFWTAVFC